MRLAALLRLTALGIALMCWLDPPSSIAPPPPVNIDVAVVRSARDGRPVSDGAGMTAADAARQSARRISDGLGSEGTVHVHEVLPGDPLPCDAVQPCANVTEGAAVSIPADRKGPLAIVPVGEPLSPNVEIAHVSAPPAHLAGQATAAVVLSGTGVRGQHSRVRLYDGEAVVGEATHVWAEDGIVSLDVPWWPVKGGSRIVEARVSTDGVNEQTPLDNALSSPVDVTGDRWRVALVERRPSWSGTFIRRALEADRRFDVAGRTDLAPAVRVATAADPLAPATLEGARVIVVGSPEALSAEDVAKLEQFARVRGGAVVLAPDRAVTGPATRLVHHRWLERLTETPASAGPLRGSEWLIAQGVSPLDQVWARTAEGPAVVSSPTGAGVVLVSGALDAWRHRDGDRGYERFWQGTIAGLAMAAGPVVSVTFEQEGRGAGEVAARITARTTRVIASWEAVATRTCADQAATPIRLWPDQAAGSFAARVPIGARTGCSLDVTIAGVGSARRALEPDHDVSSLRWTADDMKALAARTGGVVVADGNVMPLIRTWIAARGPERRPELKYPMRSWLWAIPFLLSLAGEWWARRRAGLR